MKDKITVEKRLYGYNQGGSCANCNKSISASETVRFLGKYLSGKSYITEPFNVCWDCYDKIKQ